MSIFRPTLGEKQALERRSIAFWARIQQNFWLKAISLAAAVLLYFFVQQERNPTISRTFSAPIIFDHTPQGVDVESDIQPAQMDITLIGPRPIIEDLKEGDVRVHADLSGIPTDKLSTERIPLTYDIRVREELKHELTHEPDKLPSLKVSIYPQRTVTHNIEVHFAKDAPAGVHYGRPILHPDKVTVSGRVDRVERVERVVVDATPGEPGTEIEGDFALIARDRDNNTVTGVTLSVQKAHIRIPLEKDDYSKIVSVSPLITDLPLPAYRMVSVVVEPNQVRIVGRPELVNPITTLTTEEISVHDSLEDQILEAHLKPTPGLIVRDMKGNTVSRVRVKITIVKISTPPPTGTPTGRTETTPPPPATKPDGHL